MSTTDPQTDDEGETLTARGSLLLTQAAVEAQLVEATQQLRSLTTGDFTIGTGGINRARRLVEALTAQLQLLTRARITSAQEPVQAEPVSGDFDLSGSRYTWYANATPVRLCSRYNDLQASAVTTANNTALSAAQRAHIISGIEQQLRLLEMTVQLREGLDAEIVAGSGMSADDIRRMFVFILENRCQQLLHQDARDPGSGRQHYDAAGRLAARINRLNAGRRTLQDALVPAVTTAPIPAATQGVEPTRRPWPDLTPQPDAVGSGITREQMEQVRRDWDATPPHYEPAQPRPMTGDYREAPILNVRELYDSHVDPRNRESLRSAIQSRLQMVLNRSNGRAELFEAAIADACDDIREYAAQYMRMSGPIQRALRSHPPRELTEPVQLEQSVNVIRQHYRSVPQAMRHELDNVINIARGQFADRTPVGGAYSQLGDAYSQRNALFSFTTNGNKLRVELLVDQFCAFAAAHITNTTPPGSVHISNKLLLIQHVWAVLNRNWDEPGGGADLLLGAVASAFAESSGAFRVAAGATGVRIPATRVRAAPPTRERQRVLMIDKPTTGDGSE